MTAASSKKSWTVNTSAGSAVVVEADRMELDDARVRATFFVGDEVIASFVGFGSLYPTPAAPAS